MGIPLLNNSGIVGSWADTAMPDPNAPDCQNCFLAHAFRWKHGVMSDLGALPGINFSAVGSTNARGWMAGQSNSSTIDPNVGIPEIRAVLWKNHGHILDLGVLPGGTESLSVYVNDAGQVVGFSDNGVPDPNSLFFTGTQIHTFVWEKGTMVDIGTLGGASAAPGVNCSDPEPSVIVGMSFVNDTPNPLTGIPTIDPFLWDHGKMTDLGTLGGALGAAQCANSRHQIIGQSSLPENPIACSDVLRKPRTEELPPLNQCVPAVLCQPNRTNASRRLRITDANAPWFGFQVDVRPLQWKCLFPDPQTCLRKHRDQDRQPWWGELSDTSLRA